MSEASEARAADDFIKAAPVEMSGTPAILVRLDEKVVQILDAQGRILARLDLASEQMSLLISKPSEGANPSTGMRTLLTVTITVALASLTATIAIMVVLLTHLTR